MTRLGLGCLQVMHLKNINNIVDAKTIKELLKIEDIAKFFDYQSLYRTLTSLIDSGLVSYGAKDGKALTYYVTKRGREIIREYC